MAWQRTGLGIGAVSALLLHQARGHQVAPSVPGAAGLLAALVLLLVVEARNVRSRRDVQSGRSPMGRSLVRAVAVGTFLLALAALAVVLETGS